MEMNVENCANQDIVYQLEEKFKNYALKNTIDEIREDMAKKSDLNELIS